MVVGEEGLHPEWFATFCKCQDAIRGGDSLEIESAKVAYQETKEKWGDPPVEPTSFGIFRENHPSSLRGTGANVREANTTGMKTVGEIIGGHGGLFSLLYRAQRDERRKGTSWHPPQGVCGASR